MSNKRQEPANSTSDLSMAVKSRTDKNKAAEAEDKKEGKESCKAVPFFKLFALADSLDIALMSMGTIASVANGVAFPIATIIFGNLLNAFGRGNNVVQEVSQVAFQLLYLGLGVAVASFFQVVFWMYTGESQAARIRSVYLKSILRQDIAFFDDETSTGEVIGRLSRDSILIQEAIGEKVNQ